MKQMTNDKWRMTNVRPWAARRRELLWYALVVVVAALAELWASGIAGVWR
jgi:hypothetical protein